MLLGTFVVMLSNVLAIWFMMKVVSAIAFRNGTESLQLLDDGALSRFLQLSYNIYVRHLCSEFEVREGRNRGKGNE